MSGLERRTELRFSLGFTAFQSIFFALVVAMFAYFADQYWVHPDEMAATSTRGRYAWVGDLANADGGKGGVIIFAALALLSAWYLGQAGWRFFSGGKAAMLTQRSLMLHSSYRRRGEIPFEDVLSAEIGLEPSSGMFIKRHDLHIRFRDRKAVRLRAGTTEGGVDALKAFARELNARLKVAAGPDQA